MARVSGSRPPAENLLLVEGKDDLHIIKNLLKQRGCIENEQKTNPPKLQIFNGETLTIEIGGAEEDTDTGGFNRLREGLQARLKTKSHKRIGIIVDADANCQSRWDSLRQVLSENSYTTYPSVPEKKGTIVLPNAPQPLQGEAPFTTHVGIWIMPDNSSTGAIGDFLRYLVPKDKVSLWNYAEATVESLPIKVREDENWKAKARIHSYLAWHERPGIPMGAAITEKVLTTDSETADSFVRWIEKLFNSI